MDVPPLPLFSMSFHRPSSWPVLEEVLKTLLEKGLEGWIRIRPAYLECPGDILPMPRVPYLGCPGRIPRMPQVAYLRCPTCGKPGRAGWGTGGTHRRGLRAMGCGWRTVRRVGHWRYTTGTCQFDAYRVPALISPT